MRVWLSPYELKAKKGGLRQGYLLKTQEKHEAPGYADIFPWPEFGDPMFKNIPSLIGKTCAYPLLNRSWFFSRRDALKRSEKISLIQGIEFKNHYFLSSQPCQWKKEMEKAFMGGFKTLKIKVGKNPREEISCLHEFSQIWKKEKWLRLDFNGKGNLDYFQQIRDLKPLIQFVEDPFSQSKSWAFLDWPLAYDQAPFSLDEVNCGFQIIKPAKQALPEKSPLQYVFTSYLDHPVGIAHAMAEAHLFGSQSLDYGFMSLDFYEPTPFHEAFIKKGPVLKINGDYGIGFDDLWEKQTWIEI